MGRCGGINKHQGVFLDRRFEDFLGSFLREFLDKRSGGFHNEFFDFGLVKSAWRK